jgi:hypothetical protein
MKLFTAIWYFLMLVWVVGGAGEGSLNFTWVLLLPAIYWLVRLQLSRTYTRAGNGVAICAVVLMAVVLTLAVVDTALTFLPPLR